MSSSAQDPELSLVSQAKPLGQLKPWRTGLEIAWTWAQIIAALLICLRYPSPLAYALTFVFIGARQYGLLILLHDASHTLLHPSRKINDTIALWFIAAPCGSSFINSRATHLRHHRYLGDPLADPDFFLYCSGKPAEKASIGAFVCHFAKLVAGGQIFHTLFREQSHKKEVREVNALQSVLSLLPVVMVQVALLSAFALAGNVIAYFLLWLLPLLTLAVFFNGVRVFCDHANAGREDGAGAPLLITYFSNPVERFFIAPFDMNYHAEHHLCPFVPHYNLPKLRQLVLHSSEYRDKIQWRPGYLRFILRYLRSTRGAATGTIAASKSS